MKFIALIDVVPGAPMAKVRAELAKELRESWELYASGVFSEACATEKATRVDFMLEAEDAGSAGEHLRKLPLLAAAFMRVEVIELRPFVN